MASLTVTNRVHNMFGNRRVDMGQVAVGAGVTSGEVTTKLHWIESVQMTAMNSGDKNMMVFPNAASAEADNATDAGIFHVADMTQSQTYNFIAIGW